MVDKRIVALPVYNEAANLERLLTILLDDISIDRVVAVDDCSSDASPDILRARSQDSDRLVHLTSKSRLGQLAAWRAAATAAPSGSVICFIDADALPEGGAIDALLRCLEEDASIAVSSGRVVADADSRTWPAARFRVSALHRLRQRGKVRDAVIGRFFAVRRDWFLATATRSDIIANDAFLAASAARAGMHCRYLSTACCVYAESANTFDFAAQRQRADAGYRQLRDMGLLQARDEPAILDYASALIAAAVRDPLAASAWVRAQIATRRLRAYRAAGFDQGAWDVQPSTKRALVHHVEPSERP